MVNFPAPVGGTTLPSDWAPSILFAVLYAMLLPLMIYRMTNKGSRTILLTGTVTFSIERVVFFVLRAIQAHNDSKRFSRGLVTYMQCTLGLGFIGIMNDLVNLLRCLLVNPTFGPATYFQSPAAATKDYPVEPPADGTPDHPRTRNVIRAGTNFLGLAFLASSVPGIIANVNYGKAMTDQKQADTTARLRYVSTALVPVLGTIIMICASWGTRLPRLNRRGMQLLANIVLLTSIVAVYRLVVMRYRVTSLAAPDPLNKNTAKAAFYIFHILPEWISKVILLGYNTRTMFGTSWIGDWRSIDETEDQKKKREAREARRARKRELAVKVRRNEKADEGV